MAGFVSMVAIVRALPGSSRAVSSLTTSCETVYYGSSSIGVNSNRPGPGEPDACGRSGSRRPANDRLRERFARDLNEAQRAAATAPDGFNLILAGPGSGKTRVITYRVAYLIARGVPAESILLVTFTRRAAREMVGRLEGLIGPQAAQVWAGTFHHIGNRLLRRSAELLGYGPNFTILDGEDQLDLVRLAMEDAGLVGTGQDGPEAGAGPAPDQLRLQRRPARWPRSSPTATPTWPTGLPQLEAAAEAYAAAQAGRQLHGLRRPARPVGPAARRVPRAAGRAGRGCSATSWSTRCRTRTRVQVELVEAIARAGAGNLTAVGDDAQSIYRFRGANYDNILKFPERNPGARIFRLETSTTARPPRSSPSPTPRSRHNATGFPKTLVSARPPGVRPLVVADGRRLRGGRTSSASRSSRAARRAIAPRTGWPSSTATTTTASCSRPSWSRGASPTRSGAACGSSSRPTSRTCWPTCASLVNPRDEPAWRRLLLLLPGIGPAKAAAICGRLVGAADPLAALATAETMAPGAGQEQGALRRLRRRPPQDPRRPSPRPNPAAAIAAILQGGYPATIRTQVRAAREPARRHRAARRPGRPVRQPGAADRRPPAGRRRLRHGHASTADEPGETLVLSTIHQAKGLEWSRVFVPRLIEDGFPDAPRPWPSPAARTRSGGSSTSPSPGPWTSSR